MGAIQQAAVLVDELSEAEPRLKTPILCVGDAGADHSALWEEAVHLSQEVPGIEEMLEAVAKDPALSLQQVRHSGVIDQKPHIAGQYLLIVLVG
jgi:hypothetical protein